LLFSRHFLSLFNLLFLFLPSLFALLLLSLFFLLLSALLSISSPSLFCLFLPSFLSPLLFFQHFLANNEINGPKKQAHVLLHRLHYALPGWDAVAERRDAQDEHHSAARARAWADGDFDADHGFAFDGVGRQAH
jgi:hypothetical protein